MFSDSVVHQSLSLRDVRTLVMARTYLKKTDPDGTSFVRETQQR